MSIPHGTLSRCNRTTAPSSVGVRSITGVTAAALPFQKEVKSTVRAVLFWHSTAPQAKQGVGAMLTTVAIVRPRIYWALIKSLAHGTRLQHSSTLLELWSAGEQVVLEVTVQAWISKGSQASTALARLSWQYARHH